MPAIYRHGPPGAEPYTRRIQAGTATSYDAKLHQHRVIVEHAQWTEPRMMQIEYPVLALRMRGAGGGWVPDDGATLSEIEEGRFTHFDGTGFTVVVVGKPGSPKYREILPPKTKCSVRYQEGRWQVQRRGKWE